MTMAGWYLMTPHMIYDDLSYPLLTLGKSRIHFWGEGTHKAESTTLNDFVFKDDCWQMESTV
jgi:hypothetical protein